MKLHQLGMLFLFFIFCACSTEEEESSYSIDKSTEIYVLFSPNGLGDRGYNDNILIGVLLAATERGFIPYIICPDDYKEAEELFSAWAKTETKAGIRSLFVLATNEYEQLANNYFSANDNPQKAVLLFETKQTKSAAHIFNISMYGASYLAGSISATLPHHESAILCANPKDKVLEVAAKGFEDGYFANGGTKCDRHYLSDNVGGYNMPDSAYEATTNLSSDYSFIYPLAGGSNIGVYHYTRENKGIYTAGMDSDCSSLSNNLTYSVVKKIDVLLKRYLLDWLDGKKWEKQANYTLSSGMINVTLSPNYKESLEETYINWLEKAIKAEDNNEKIH